MTPNGKQYTLEFINFESDTIAVVPVEPVAVRAIGSREVTHARLVDEAS